MSKERKKFSPGEFFIYKNGDRLELGKVKRMADEGAMAYYCWYSCGTTAARTPVELMLKWPTMPEDRRDKPRLASCNRSSSKIGQWKWKTTSRKR